MAQNKSILDKATIVRSRRKTVKIIVTSRGELIISAPMKYSISSIEKLVESKRDWIQTKVEYASKTVEKNRFILSYDHVLLCGEPYRVVLADMKKVSFADHIIYIPQSKSDKKVALIKSTFKKVAQNMLPNRIEELSKKYKIDYSTISITDSKSRWGSCDRSGNIKLNLRLVMLRPEIIDFVISHELAHRVEFNHSKEFYNVLAKLIPNWKALRRELKSYSFLLSLYR